MQTLIPPDIERLLRNFLSAKSPGLIRHSEHTAEIALVLATYLDDSGVTLGCSRDFVFYAGLVHDIGKCQVPEVILDKHCSLAPRELEAIRLHTLWGAEIVRGTCLECFANTIADHHEKADGSGYPAHKLLNDIDMATRIVSVADMVSALIEDRPYKRAICHKDYVLRTVNEDIESLFQDSAAVVKSALTFCLEMMGKNSREITHQPRILNFVSEKGTPPFFQGETIEKVVRTFKRLAAVGDAT